MSFVHRDQRYAPHNRCLSYFDPEDLSEPQPTPVPSWPAALGLAVIVVSFAVTVAGVVFVWRVF